MNPLSIKIQAVFWLLILLLTASCSGSVYSHYPKVKSKQAGQETAKPVLLKKFESLASKTTVLGLQLGSDSLFGLNTFVGVVIPVKNKTSKVKKADKKETVITGNGRPDDVTPVNKKAKVAFWFSIAALGSLIAGLSISLVFIALMVLCAVFAFIYAIKALKRIKNTGEYGRPKAEFALFVSIPLLLFTLILIWAVLSLKSGGGIQFGTITFF
jgi:hypothetical protein